MHAVRKQNPPRIRKSITPGTVLILLAGRFRGKRVVCLKSLESGLLLVTGPYKLNGVPLRRVNQAYVIATSTKIDISGVAVPENLNDAYFKKPSAVKQAKGEEEFFQAKESKTPLSESRIADQKAVDAALIPIIKKEQFLSHYLKARFSLKKGDRPH